MILKEGSKRKSSFPFVLPQLFLKADLVGEPHEIGANSKTSS